MSTLLMLLGALLLTACSLGPAQKDAPAVYDLGAPRQDAANQPRIYASLLVHAVAAPAWLDTTAIIYRLNYQDAARQRAYANSRWAAAPAALLTQRLRGRLAAASDGGVVGAGDSARADYTLRVEIEDFSQVFVTADESRAVIVARASIFNAAKRTLLAQKSFSTTRPAASANAEGGVRALAAAGDETIEAIAVWAAASMAQERN
jgi:cholesterol transport system auxiliary component